MPPSPRAVYHFTENLNFSVWFSNMINALTLTKDSSAAGANEPHNQSAIINRQILFSYLLAFL